jgi:RHS repeat-associated protein
MKFEWSPLITQEFIKKILLRAKPHNLHHLHEREASPMRGQKLSVSAAGLVASLCVTMASVSAQSVGNVQYYPGQGQCNWCCDSDWMVMHVANGAQSGAAPGDYTVTYHRYVTDPGGNIVGDGGNGVFGVGVHANDSTVYTAGNELWDITKVHEAIQTAVGGQAIIEFLSVAPSNDGYGGDPNVQLAGQKKWRITRLEPCTGCGGTTTVNQLMPVVLVGGAGASGLAPDPNKTTPNDPNTGCPEGAPMASYSIHLMLASLHIEDTPISYHSPRGPATGFKVVYNQREANQPSTFSFCNLGPKWTFNWLSYVTDDPASPSANATVYVRGGGTETYTGFNSGTQSYAPEPQSMAVLVRTSSTSYEKRFPDGSKEVFAVGDGSTSYPRRIFLTSVVDSAGNVATITYDSSFRITTITDSLGQATTLTYGLTGDPLKITKVTDPFSRFATFEYTNGELSSITDPVGIQSQFAYQTGTDFINAMTTPYGTTSFATGQTGNTLRWIEATDPLGGKERVEYNDSASGVASSEGVEPPGVYNSGLQNQNTFYWNKKAMADAPGDYTKAQVIHWLSTTDGKVSGIKHSEKKPLENRVWYTYSGQSDAAKVGTSALPTAISRVLDDGSVQQRQYQYNSLGNLTQETDPAGRVFSYVYAPNGIDLLEKRQTRSTNNDLLVSFTYNSQHLPLTATDAARETTTYTYNSYGQPMTVTNAKNETITYGYDRDQDSDGITDGYLVSIARPATGAITTFAYDTAERVQTVTDSDAYAVTATYDNIDRPLTITYPDTTTRQFSYNDNVSSAMLLDVTGIKDRRGRWTYRYYNGNRKITKLTDPLGRNTLFDWCMCGALNSITDGSNNVTTFARDVQGRVSSKTFANTTSISYTYENSTSRLKSSTDAKNQTTNYQYFADDDLKQTSYTNAQIATPSVTFTYDPNYNRVSTMVDGTGTTTYNYNTITGSVSLGAGQLQSVVGPLANSTVVYTYDELGRELSESVNSVTGSQTYDSLGRIGTTTNPLGTFTNSYVANSNRLQTISLPNGQLATYSYFPNSGDKRLETIQNTTAGGTILSKFDYLYDADGEITKLARQLGPSGFPMVWSNGANPMNDAADQLTNLTEQQSASQYAVFAWTYDNAGNRTSDNNGTYTLNSVNQITNTGYTYDNNGNLTADPFRTYEWDAANRLTAINYSTLGGRTEFTYDGLGRRVKIVEKNPGMTMTAQAPNTSYTSFTSSSFTLSSGTYTLTIQGLNPNGGDNTMFVDAVALNGTLVPNGGFETPNLGSGGYAYGPSGATWTFQGNAGMSNNGSGFTSSNPNAPEGNQVAVVQMNGSISQSLTLATGNYTLTFYGAQRANWQSSYQQVQVSVQAATQIASTKQCIWIGNRIAEERDVNNNVVRRFYPQGEQISGTSYFYTRDHLGSVRELTDASSTIRARYDYDPYGYSTKLSGDLDAEFGYTGHYYHQQSGLNLAFYRPYDHNTGRWLGRDPIHSAEIHQGPNLYWYVRNNPLRYKDVWGDQLREALENLNTGEDPVYGNLFDLIGALYHLACQPEDPETPRYNAPPPRGFDIPQPPGQPIPTAPPPPAWPGPPPPPTFPSLPPLLPREPGIWPNYKK